MNPDRQRDVLHQLVALRLADDPALGAALAELRPLATNVERRAWLERHYPRLAAERAA